MEKGAAKESKEVGGVDVDLDLDVDVAVD